MNTLLLYSNIAGLALACRYVFKKPEDLAKGMTTFCWVCVTISTGSRPAMSCMAAFFTGISVLLMTFPRPNKERRQAFLIALLSSVGTTAFEDLRGAYINSLGNGDLPALPAMDLVSMDDTVCHIRQALAIVKVVYKDKVSEGNVLFMKHCARLDVLAGRDTITSA